MLDPFPPVPTSGDLPWVGPLRAAGAAAVAALDRPTSAEEIWRYTDPSAIPLDGAAQPAVSGSRDVAPELRDFDAAVVVVVSEAGEVATSGTAPGVHAGALRAATGAGQHAGTLVAAGQDVFTALNAAHFADGVCIDIAAGARVERPILVVHRIDTPGVAAFPRTLVVAGAGAEAEIVEVWTSGGAAPGAVVAAVGELHVLDGAHLRYTGVQRLDDGADFVATQGARVGRDAHLGFGTVNVGARLGRLRCEFELDGPGAECRVVGVYFGDGDRQVDFRTLQRHVAPRGTSDLLFRGAVADRSRAITSGLIRVEQSAPRSDAHQATRSLVLSEHAQAQSIPNLEILNNDVRCGHASAGGPPDEDQLFYLESRGIAPEVAHRLIVDGFFDEIIRRLPVQSVQPFVRAEIVRRVVASREQAGRAA